MYAHMYVQYTVCMWSYLQKLETTHIKFLQFILLHYFYLSTLKSTCAAAIQAYYEA